MESRVHRLERLFCYILLAFVGFVNLIHGSLSGNESRGTSRSRSNTTTRSNGSNGSSSGNSSSEGRSRNNNSNHNNHNNSNGNEASNNGKNAFQSVFIGQHLLTGRPHQSQHRQPPISPRYQHRQNLVDNGLFLHSSSEKQMSQPVRTNTLNHKKANFSRGQIFRGVTTGYNDANGTVLQDGSKKVLNATTSLRLLNTEKGSPRQKRRQHVAMPRRRREASRYKKAEKDDKKVYSNNTRDLYEILNSTGIRINVLTDSKKNNKKKNQNYFLYNTKNKSENRVPNIRSDILLSDEAITGRNTGGAPLAESESFRVFHPPHQILFLKKPPSHDVSETGDTLTYECEVDTSNLTVDPEIYWTIPDRITKEKKGPEDLYPGEFRHDVFVDDNHTLIIKNVQMEHRGMYICVVSVGQVTEMVTMVLRVMRVSGIDLFIRLIVGFSVAFVVIVGFGSAWMARRVINNRKSRSSNLVTCSACQVLKYCKPECQELDWKIHCLECQCVKNMAPESPSETTRLLLRLVIRMQTGDHHKMHENNEIFRRPFTDLMSHYDDLQSEGVYFNEAEIAKCAKNCLDLPSNETLQEMFGKVLINSFIIPDEYLASLGIGVYLSTSILNHSCAPNAIVGYEETEQTLYALTDIPQLAPEKLFISYIEVCFPSWQRRDRLLDNYYFYCQCHWCENDASYIDHIMTSASCPVSECSGFTGITGDQDGCHKMLPCTNCGKKEFSQDYEQIVMKIWNYGNECCDKLEKLQKNENFEDVLSLSEKVLQEFEESIMYESNLLFIRVREFAIGACTELKLWAKAAEYGEKVWPQKMKCIPNANYSIGLLLIELGKFYLNDHNIPEARRVFNYADNLVIHSHGLNSFTHKETVDLLNQCDEIELVRNGIMNIDTNYNTGVKHAFKHIKHNISKRFRRIPVPSFWRTRHSNTKKRKY